MYNISDARVPWNASITAVIVGSCTSQLAKRSVLVNHALLPWKCWHRMQYQNRAYNGWLGRASQNTRRFAWLRTQEVFANNTVRKLFNECPAAIQELSDLVSVQTEVGIDLLIIQTKHFYRYYIIIFTVAIVKHCFYLIRAICNY